MSITEKRLKVIKPILFIADGDIYGKVTLSDTANFVVKQIVSIQATGLPNLVLEVKRVESDTVLYVGPQPGNIDARTDISLYTIAANSFIYADQQHRPTIPVQEITRYAYAEEPAVAHRTLSVDQYGQPISADNPLPVIGDITVIADISTTINIDGLQDVISVSTTPVDVKIGATTLVGRKLVTVYNNGTKEIYWGYKNTVTAATGTVIFRNQLMGWDIGDNLHIWLVAAQGSHEVRITEAS